MIDWLKAKLKGHTHYCWECNKYIANEKMNELYPDNHNSCEGGGFCCPIYRVPYFIGIDKYDTFCTKFKFKGDDKLKEKFFQLVKRKRKKKQND